ncbi:MAG: hypothetical protein JKX98_01985 [Alcanivoracaceae bacterium]|nr:hypothetical protein [Alcanivoracaceae bacterium]
MRNTLIVILIFLFQSFAFAGEADVLVVDVTKNTNNTYSFSVTVSHKDSGWDHYVNKWEVIDKDNNVLAVRVLHHPHVNEQPFTRSLSGIEIPDSINTVTVRAYDSVHEYGGKTLMVKLPEK